MQSVKPRCAGRDNLGSARWLARSLANLLARYYFIIDDGTQKLFTILCLLPTTNKQQQQQTSHYFRVIGTLPLQLSDALKTRTQTRSVGEGMISLYWARGAQMGISDTFHTPNHEEPTYPACLPLRETGVQVVKAAKALAKE